MITVIIAAQDQTFWKAVSELLDEHLAPVHAHGKALDSKGASPSLILCDMDSFSHIKSEQVIVVFQQAVPLTARLEGAEQVVAVVDSCDAQVLSLVAGTQLAAITCGLSSKDTVTLSSMDTDSAVINIQRAIQCFDGSEVEPQEIPVRFSRPIDSFVLMAAASVCILSGRLDILQGGVL